MDTMEAARRWAVTWKRAWEAQDTDAVVALYHPEALLSTQPFRVAYLRRAGVHEYVSQAFAEEEAVRAWVGSPIVEGDRAAIEWWATLLENGVETTLAGTSVLRFGNDGLVIEQRDTWNQLNGRREPPDNWGR